MNTKRCAIKRLVSSSMLASMCGVIFIMMADFTAHASSGKECENLPHSDHPMARISNGQLNAVIFLPDEHHAYYRGSRFDWSGVIGCVSLKGHTFFGEWFARYEPTINDAITGPVEEFRSPTSEIGYDEAAPGGLFIKPGVGVLRRIDNKPYRFGNAYPIVEAGAWSVKVRKQSVTFRQELHSPIGIAYVYEKIVSLDAHDNVLHLEHHLTNIGSKIIDTEVYDHDFFMLDHKPTGPGMQVRFLFAPKPDQPFPSSMLVEKNTVKFIAPLEKSGAGTYITGYASVASNYDITTEDTNAKFGVQQTSKSPIARVYFWATQKTICPEAYIRIHVEPARNQAWTINYRFFAH